MPRYLQYLTAKVFEQYVMGKSFQIEDGQVLIARLLLDFNCIAVSLSQ